MPKKFKFIVDNETQFQCDLQSQRCTANTNNARCRNKTVIGLGLCWQHLLRERHLRVLDTQYGKGLFAMRRGFPQDEIIFRPGEFITEYNGEDIDREELDARYGQYTSPYGNSKRQQNQYEDGACQRGIGTLVNHGNANLSNAEFRYFRDGSIKIIASKIIRNGRQILVNYNAGNRRRADRYRFDEPGVRHYTR